MRRSTRFGQVGIAVLGLCVVLGCGGVPSSSGFDRASIVHKVHEQTLRFEASPGTRAVEIDTQQANFTLVEFVRQEESVDDWSELLVIQGFQGLAAKMTTAQGLNAEAKGIEGACPDAFVRLPLQLPVSPTLKEPTQVIMGCDKTQNLKAERAAYISFKSGGDLFLFKKAFRSNDDQVELDESNVVARASELLSLSIEP